MKSLELTGRNLKEIARDPLSMGLGLVLPIGLFVLLQSLGGDVGQANILSPTMLAPGISLFGFAMLVFSSGFLLARDRENSLLARLLTTPLRPSDFIVAYALPYLPLAILQVAALFGIGSLLGLQIAGNAGLVFVILIVMSLGYIGVGMILGSLLTSKQVGVAYTAVLLPTIFSGTWFDLNMVGDGFRKTMELLPFTHALTAVRSIMVDNAGLADVALDLLWVAGYSTLLLALGVLAFKSRMAG